MTATTQQLAFRIRVADSAADLAAARAVRAAGYGRHVPALEAAFAAPDPADAAPGTVVFVCEDKREHRAIGTVRLQTNRYAPLAIEAGAPLPAPFAAAPRAEATRLAVVDGADRLVRLALMKATYLAARAAGVEWLVIGARTEALVRLYRGIGCFDLYGDERWIALPHAGGVPHRVLAFSVSGAEPSWRAASHPLYPFMIETYHHDISIGP